MLRAAACLFYLLQLQAALCPAQQTEQLTKTQELKTEERLAQSRLAENLAKSRARAVQGSALHQYSLGDMYNRGLGVPGDYAQAAFWYRKAAEQGHRESQYKLGLMYRFGQGLKENLAESAFWLRKAAEQWHPEAQYELAYVYNEGKGVPKDSAEAVLWLTKAAQGKAPINALAQHRLGIWYAEGIGVPKDEIEAYAWFNLCSVSSEQSKKKRDALEEVMAPEARMKAQARTKELQKLVEQRLKDLLTELSKLESETNKSGGK